MADGALYAAVILAVLSAISALAYAITQVLHAWRAVKSLRRNALREGDRLVELADKAAAKAEPAADSTLRRRRCATMTTGRPSTPRWKRAGASRRYSWAERRTPTSRAAPSSRLAAPSSSTSAAVRPTLSWTDTTSACRSDRFASPSGTAK